MAPIGPVRTPVARLGAVQNETCFLASLPAAVRLISWRFLSVSLNLIRQAEAANAYWEFSVRSDSRSSARWVIEILIWRVVNRLWVVDTRAFWCRMRPVYKESTIAYLVHDCSWCSVWRSSIGCWQQSLRNAQKLRQREWSIVHTVYQALEVRLWLDNLGIVCIKDAKVCTLWFWEWSWLWRCMSRLQNTEGQSVTCNSLKRCQLVSNRITLNALLDRISQSFNKRSFETRFVTNGPAS